MPSFVYIGSAQLVNVTLAFVLVLAGAWWGPRVALAAVLSGAFDVRDKTVAVVCSGGNVAPDLFARALAAAGEG